MTLTDKLERLKELEGRATKGPWGYCYDGSSDWSIGEQDDPQEKTVLGIWSKDDDKAGANCKFITTIRDTILPLIRVIEIQREALEQISKGENIIEFEAQVAEEALRQSEEVDNASRT